MPSQRPVSPSICRREVRIPPLGCPGILRIPEHAAGIVVFAHGSGSSHLSPRNNYVAGRFLTAGLGSLLFDLLTEDEARDRRNVFDIPLLGARLGAAIRWVETEPDAAGLRIGLFGASTGAAACLVAAARTPGIGAIVSRGGRPDLAGKALPLVGAPTLLIVGSHDPEVLSLNRTALSALRCTKALEVVAGATHLFEEPGTLDTVVSLGTEWFLTHLRTGPDT